MPEAYFKYHPLSATPLRPKALSIVSQQHARSACGATSTGLSLRDYGLVDLFSSLSTPMHMVARHILMQQLDGGTGPRLFLRRTRSYRPVVFAVSLRLGSMTATALGRISQPTIDLSCPRCRCNRHSLPHSSSVLLSSHSKHGPLPIWPNAGHLTFAILQSCMQQAVTYCTSVPSRSFRCAHRVEYCVPRWHHQTGLILPFWFILSDHMKDFWISYSTPIRSRRFASWSRDLSRILIVISLSPIGSQPT
jgi:hypothetical protein